MSSHIGRDKMPSSSSMWSLDSCGGFFHFTSKGNSPGYVAWSWMFLFFFFLMVLGDGTQGLTMLSPVTEIHFVCVCVCVYFLFVGLLFIWFAFFNHCLLYSLKIRGGTKLYLSFSFFFFASYFRWRHGLCLKRLMWFFCETSSPNFW